MRSIRLLGAAAAGMVGAVLVVSSCGYATTVAATGITDHSARLNGNIGNTVTGDLRFHFEYGTTDAYGTSTPEGTVTITDASVPVFVSSNDLVQGLAEATTYHYRLCAFDVGNDGGGGCSPDATFTTTTGDDYVYGHGWVVAPFGPHGGYVDAISDHDGSGPTGTAGVDEANTSPLQHFQSSGTVTCLRVEGNRATVGLLASIPGLGVARPVVILIEDGAATGTPDTWTTKWLDGFAGPTSCPAPNVADFPQLVLYAPSPPYPPGTFVTIPREIDPSCGCGFVVHDHP